MGWLRQLTHLHSKRRESHSRSGAESGEEKNAERRWRNRATSTYRIRAEGRVRQGAFLWTVRAEPAFPSAVGGGSGDQGG